MIYARHHVPLTAQHIAVAIFHLISITDERQRVLSAHQCCCFQCPQFAIVRLHQQVLVTYGTILTVVVNGNMQTFAPCGIIMYGKLEFHIVV